MLTLDYRCTLPAGLHARPATEIETACRAFDCEIRWLNLRSGQTANAKSVLSLLSSDTQSGDDCRLEFQGEDAERAAASLQSFLLRLKDDAMPSTAAAKQRTQSRALRESGTKIVPGTAVSAGLASGTLCVLPGQGDGLDATRIPQESAAVQRARLDAACVALDAQLEQERRTAKAQVAAILDAHRAMLNDAGLRADLEAACAAHPSLFATVSGVEARHCTRLEAASSAYLRERVADVRDVCRRLRRTAYPEAFLADETRLPEGALIAWAAELTPSQFLALDRTQIKGLVVEHLGPTSHTAILARAFGLPTLSGIAHAVPASDCGQGAVLDGDAGILLPAPNDAGCRHVQRLLDAQAIQSRRLAEGRQRAALSADGVRLEIAANIACAAEVQDAFDSGAEGIGLFRTEMLFMDRDAPPTENEQAEAYAQVLRVAQGRPVIIRTFDIGGDKPVAYLGQAEETNPFLGCRGVRLYPHHEALFRTQLRALLRASVEGPLRIMTPMVSQVEEMRWVRARLDEERTALEAAGVGFGARIELGMMLEVPAVLFQIPAFCHEVDFFSVGSNDLTQYLLAVNRDNGDVADYYRSAHPALLNALKHAVDQAHAHGRWMGLCGEMGAERRLLPLLVGLGLDEISLAAPKIAETRYRLSRLNAARCRDLLNLACDGATTMDVAAALDTLSVAEPEPMLLPELIVLDADAPTKVDAIHLLVSRLWAAGRSDAREDLEAALWQREETYSTGVGYGIAIPHAKTAAIARPSIAVARLNKGVVWGSLDGADVDVVILLAFGEQAGHAHLRIFSKLARRIMHADFREALRSTATSEALYRLLCDELELNEVKQA